MNEFITRLYVVMQTGMLDLRKRAESERGATAVEYGLLVFLIAAAVVGTVTALGLRLNVIFGNVLTAIGGGAPAAP
jgi:pilus assembly protein Flp/PilA